jgi:hypothetical protein
MPVPDPVCLRLAGEVLTQGAPAPLALNNAGAASGQCEALALFTVARRCRDPKPEPRRPQPVLRPGRSPILHRLIGRVAPLAARWAADSVGIVQPGAAKPASSAQDR